MARQRSSAVLVGLGLVVVLVLVWQLRDALDPVPDPAPGPRDTASPVVAAPSRSERAPRLSSPPLPAPSEPPELRGHDTIDPCTAGFEPELPADAEVVIAHDITLAVLPLDDRGRGSIDGKPRTSETTLQPTSVAYLVAGLLEEAATLTGTTRRERLTVIVYPTQAELLARTHAPPWARAIYDGGAVRIALDPSADLGIAVPTLRHELMHAQLHAAVGCIPAWFNEGLAMYFAGRPPARTWVRMLRSPEAFELVPLQAPTLSDLPADRADRAYGHSLAMLIYLVEHGGEAGIRAAVRTVLAVTDQTRRPVIDLWERLYPGVTPRAVLDSLTRRVFGVPPGPELDTMLQAAVCCRGMRNLAGFACHGAPVVADQLVWIDAASRDVCYATW